MLEVRTKETDDGATYYTQYRVVGNRAMPAWARCEYNPWSLAASPRSSIVDGAHLGAHSSAAA